MDAELRGVPFKHYVCASIFPPAKEEKLRIMLEHFTWEFVSDSFFSFSVPSTKAEIEEFSFIIFGLSHSLNFQKILSNMFDVNIKKPTNCEIHKYSQGSGIGPHTDANSNEVRLVVNFNDTWNLRYGGVWVLSDSSKLKENITYLPPVSNTGFAFMGSNNSYHALTHRSGSKSYAIALRYEIEQK